MSILSRRFPRIPLGLSSGGGLAEGEEEGEGLSGGVGRGVGRGVGGGVGGGVGEDLGDEDFGEEGEIDVELLEIRG